MMTTIDIRTRLKQSMGVAITAAAMLAVAAPAMAGHEAATRELQIEAENRDDITLRGNWNNSSTVPHRPESDPYFPRR